MNELLFKIRFPGGKDKALTLSYDDDVKANARLMEILDRYGIKGTFNLNFGLFRNDSDLHLSKDDAVALYADSPHEVAIHGYNHLCLGKISDAAGVWDVIRDRREAEKTFGRIIRGMAYANGAFDEKTGEALKICGIAYSRTTRATRAFDLPSDWHYLDPTCHHSEPRLTALADRFLSEPVYRDAKLFYLWGHAYEFDSDNNWNVIEEFCEKTGNRDDVWYATNIEIHDYVRAFEQLIFSVEENLVYNPTGTEIFFALAHPWKKEVPPVYSVRPGETLNPEALRG